MSEDLDGNPQDSSKESTRASSAIGERPMSVADIQTTYAECADWFHRFEWLDRLITGSYRRRRFGDVEGRVLDVACGTGVNFPYLPQGVELVGIDASPEMLRKARETLDERPVEGTLHQMDAQQLAFPENSFDAVISALSTCTFPDPVEALTEMERVCTPEGTIRLVEHGLSTVGPIARFQHWRAEAHYRRAACRWTQEPREIVEKAGLEVQETSTGLLGMVTTFELTPG